MKDYPRISDLTDYTLMEYKLVKMIFTLYPLKKVLVRILTNDTWDLKNKGKELD